MITPVNIWTTNVYRPEIFLFRRLCLEFLKILFSYALKPVPFQPSTLNCKLSCTKNMYRNIWNIKYPEQGKLSLARSFVTPRRKYRRPCETCVYICTYTCMNIMTSWMDLAMFLYQSVYRRTIPSFFKYRSEIWHTSFSPQETVYLSEPIWVLLKCLKCPKSRLTSFIFFPLGIFVGLLQKFHSVSTTIRVANGLSKYSI